MARIKITIPKQGPIFETNLQVRVDDINYGQHLSHDRYLTLTHQARVEYLKSRQQSELEFLSPGHGLIMNEAVINYLNEAYLGDQLQFRFYLGDISNFGFELIVEIIKKSNGNVEKVANIKTTMIYFDYKNKKPIKLPDNITDTLK